MRRPLISALLISIIAFGIYLPSLNNDFVNWDDNQYVYENPYIRSIDIEFLNWAFTGFYAAYWAPLTWLSLAIDYSIHGYNPWGYHLTNAILHALNTFLIVLIAIKLSGMVMTSKRRISLTAVITGILFAVHPVHVESVAWVTERKDVLYSLFFLLSVLSYVRYAEDKKGKGPWSNPWYFTTLAMFILSLLSKPMAIVMPVTLLLLDWYPLERFDKGSPKDLLKEKVPFVMLSLVVSVIIYHAQRSGGTIAPLSLIPMTKRMLVSTNSLIMYIVHMILPIDLSPVYPYPHIRDISLTNIRYLIPLLLVISITIVCILLIKRTRLWFATWLFYITTLLPVLGIIQTGPQAMADRYLYLASTGFFLLVGAGLSGMFERLWTSNRRALAGLSLLSSLVFLIPLSTITVRQINIWHDGLSLWNAVIERYPDTAAIPYRNRGDVYLERDMLQEALADYSMAIRLDPSLAVAYNQRAIVYTRLGIYPRALDDLNKAISLSKSPEPSYYNNRGVVHARLGMLKKAIEDYSEAIRLNPLLREAYKNRAIAYLKLGMIREAERDLRMLGHSSH